MPRANLATEKERLLATIEAAGVCDRRVLAAIRRVPRERFVAPDQQELAYANVALPIPLYQTISQPEVVALMAQAAQVSASDRVLEVGTGSGYGAAVLAELGGDVVSIEIRPRLAEEASRLLSSLGYEVRVVIADGGLGWAADAPYDVIVVTAAAPRVPPALFRQLNEDGGRLVAPVGTPERQDLVLARRQGGKIRVEVIGHVRFVPLAGAASFASPDPDRRN